MQADSIIISPPSWTEGLPLNKVFAPPAPTGPRPLLVDVGCGKGRFLTAKAKANPDVDFLGIDRLLRRLKKVEKKVAREGLTNVRLLRIEASYAIRYLLPPESVSVLYILFPDPWPKRRHHRRRLFNRAFLDSLYRVLQPGGHVNVATDHLDYFRETWDLFREDRRFNEVPAFVPGEDEKTEFELAFLGQNSPIGRCSFTKSPPAAS